MTPLSVFRDRHKGQPVAILGNGTSLLDHDLSKLRCRTMGVNMSWSVWCATYHVAVEHAQAKRNPDAYRALAKGGRLFVAGGGWEIGHVMPILEPSRKGVPKFSRDITEGVVVSMDGCGSVLYVALQVAAFMGFSPIYLLGVDLQGEHFHREWAASSELYRQNELFVNVPEDVEVYVVGSPESKALFPKITFEEVVRAVA